MIGRRHNGYRDDRPSGKRQKFDGREASPGRRGSDSVGPWRSPLSDKTFRAPYNRSSSPRNLRSSSGKKLDMRSPRFERRNENRDRDHRGSRNRKSCSSYSELYYMDKHGSHSGENRQQTSQQTPGQTPPEISCVAEFPTLSNTGPKPSQQNSQQNSQQSSWNSDQSSVNPEKSGKFPKRTRQSTESSDSSWSEIVNEDEERTERVKKDLERFRARLRSAHNEDAKAKEEAFESDLEVLKRRQKQIDYGKRTPEYEKYKEVVPKKERSKDHPWTPNKFFKHSRRNWDAKIRTWRKVLHIWDPPNNNSVDDGVSVSSEISGAFDDATPGSSQSEELQLAESLGRISVTPPPLSKDLDYDDLQDGDGDMVEFLEI